MQTDAEDTFAEDTENNADETDDDDPTETMTPARRAQAEARWEELNGERTHPGLDGSEEDAPVLRRRNAGVVLPNLAHIERDRKIKKKPPVGKRGRSSIAPVTSESKVRGPFVCPLICPCPPPPAPPPPFFCTCTPPPFAPPSLLISL